MIGRIMSFQGRSGRRAFLAVWLAAGVLLVPLGVGSLSLIRGADAAGAPDAWIAMLGAGLIFLALAGHLWPVLAASVRRARDLGASVHVLGLVVAVELMGSAARAWGQPDALWLYGLPEAAVFLILCLWPGQGEAEAARAYMP